MQGSAPILNLDAIEAKQKIVTVYHSQHTRSNEKMVATKTTLNINKVSRWVLPTQYTQRMMAWMVIDVTVIMVAYTLAFFSRSIATKIVFVENIWFIGIATGIIAVFLVRFGVYRRIWSMTSGHDVSIILNA